MVGTNLNTMLHNNNFAVIISAELTDCPNNATRTTSLITSLVNTGLRYMPVDGVYKGKHESSFIVFCDDVFDVLRITTKGLTTYGQECVLVLDLNKGRAILNYADYPLMIGSQLKNVEQLEALTHDAYTVVDGEYWVVL